MLQNARVTAFIASELLREIQQGVKLPPPHTHTHTHRERLGLNLNNIAKLAKVISQVAKGE